MTHSEQMEDRIAQLIAENNRLRAELSERGRVEQRVQEYFFGIFEFSSFSMFSVDTNYCYTSFNRKHANVMKAIYNANIELGKSILEYQTVETDRIKAQAHLDQALRGENIVEEAYSGEEVLKQVYLRIAHNPIRGAEGNVIGAAVYVQDLTERQRTEEELRANKLQLEQAQRESEERYRDLFEQSPCAIAIHDGNTIINVNPAMVSIGRFDSSDELIGHRVLDFIHPDDQAEISERIRAIIGENVQTTPREARILRKDGSVASCTFAGGVCHYQGRKLIQSIVYDLTEQKRNQEALRRSEATLEAIFEAIPHAVYFGTEKGITRCNAQALQMLGASSLEDLQARIGELGSKFRVRYRKDDRDDLVEPEDLPFVHALNGKVAVLNTWVTRGDNEDDALVWGNAAPVIVDGEILGAVAINIDITDQYLMQQELRESLNRLSFALEGTNDGIWDVQMKTGEVYISPRGCEILGYAPDDMGELIKVWDQLVHPEDMPLTTEKLNAHIKGAAPIFEVEQRLKMKSGEWKWILTRGKVVAWDDQGNPLRALGTHTDITVRKQAEEEIHRLNEDLEQRVQERTAELKAAFKELEAFSFSVSHDLRAPLRGINGWGAALAEEYGYLLDAQGKEYLARVQAGAERMGRLIDDILKLSRITQAELRQETVNLSAIAQRIADNLRQSQPERIAVFTIEPELTVRGDASMLEIALTNLLGNAFKFTGTRTEASIKFGRCVVEGKPTFFIKDNGVGFDMTYVDRLFGAFQRLHPASSFAGTGIGLAIVQRVINKHNGRIWVEAVVDEGATFYFQISE